MNVWAIEHRARDSDQFVIHSIYQTLSTAQKMLLHYCTVPPGKDESHAAVLNFGALQIREIYLND